MKIAKLIYLSCFISVLFFSCQEKKVKEQYTFEDIPSSKLDSINMALASSDTSKSGIITNAAKGSLWTSFMKTFKDCFQDETFTKGIIYLGPTNSKYLGAILSNDKQITWKSLEKVLNGNEKEMNKFCAPSTNPADNCDKNELLNNYLGVLLNGTAQNVDANLKLAIEDRKSIKMLTGKWRIDEILLGDFNSYMDATKDSAVIDYKKYLTMKDNFIITKILVLENFSAEIESNRKLDAGLQAELQKGISAPTASVGADSTRNGVKIGFSNGSNGTIKMNATGKSYVIGMLQKVNKIKPKL
ncbi:hypothetical protein [Pedobacter nutrimenti]|uniref:hypothetical protein n=1 Tax=Pedobacter nutrimenti TaxID=1241337 RepID=UPI0029301C99|nr:hypothetical protein [Pedobacter nutrimenti]